MSSENLKEPAKVTPRPGDELSDERDVRRAVAPHQHDFPYERGEEAHVTRREFCNFLALTSTALFVSAAGFAAKAALDARRAETFEPKRIDGAEAMTPGSSMNFRYPSDTDTAILVRAADGAYHAYGQKCTHLACPVYYEQRRGRLECPCHEGGFDIKTGSVLYGPPPRPLDRIRLETRANGEVWAVGREAVDNERSV
jgi:Rieske Fe-S protein